VKQKSARKKLLVLSSKGGYGHSAAVSTLQKILNDRYDIEIIHPINEVRFCGIFFREKIYNQMLLKGWIRSMNLMAGIFAPFFISLCTKKIQSDLEKSIEKAKPDLVISLIPFLNLPAIGAAETQKKPYLLITIDNDLKNWMRGLKEVTHPKFNVTIGHKLPTTTNYLKKVGIGEQSIHHLGLPLRLEFTQKRDKKELRAQYQIAADRSVILLMMGGAGATRALEYARHILQIPLSTHLIVCAGNNLKLIEQLKALPSHPSNTLTVYGFSQNICDLMAMADVLITKPGPGTINEAVAMRLPVLLDNTKTSLFWERINLEMVKQYGIGTQINDFKSLKSLLEEYLKSPAKKKALQKAFDTTPPCTFHESIESLIAQMCL